MGKKKKRKAVSGKSYARKTRQNERSEPGKKEDSLPGQDHDADKKKINTLLEKFDINDIK